MNLSEIGCLYIAATQPALLHVGVALPDNDPSAAIDFTAVRSPRFQGLHGSTVRVPRHSISDFTEHFLVATGGDPRFHACFFGYQLSPGDTWHDISEVEERTKAHNIIQFKLGHLAHAYRPASEQRVCRISMRFRYPGQALLWQPAALENFLIELRPWARPELTDEEIEEIVGGAERAGTVGAVTFAMCHKTTVTLSKNNSSNMKAIEFRALAPAESDKLPGFKVFTAQDTYPQRTASMLDALEAASTQCNRLAALDNGRGDVEAFVSLDMDYRHSRNALTTFPAVHTLFWDVKRTAWW